MGLGVLHLIDFSNPKSKPCQEENAWTAPIGLWPDLSTMTASAGARLCALESINGDGLGVQLFGHGSVVTGSFTKAACPSPRAPATTSPDAELAALAESAQPCRGLRTLDLTGHIRQPRLQAGMHCVITLGRQKRLGVRLPAHGRMVPQLILHIAIIQKFCAAEGALAASEAAAVLPPA